MNTKPDIQLHIINSTEVELGSGETYVTQIVKPALQKGADNKNFQPAILQGQIDNKDAWSLSVERVQKLQIVL